MLLLIRQAKVKFPAWSDNCEGPPEGRVNPVVILVFLFFIMLATYTFLALYFKALFEL